MASYNFPDLSGFPDCIALTERGKCTRLRVPNCLGHVCTFKRSSEEDRDSIQYANQRLSSLDASIQKRIARKYYGGSMPWRKMTIVNGKWKTQTKYKVNIMM
jgi:hypothetical protein